LQDAVMNIILNLRVEMRQDVGIADEFLRIAQLCNVMPYLCSFDRPCSCC